MEFFEAVDNRFTIYFYYRTANQLINQAKVYREEGNSAGLYRTLKSYSRLMSEIIPQHRDYATYSSKVKLHHRKGAEVISQVLKYRVSLPMHLNQILQGFAKELEKMKPVIERENTNTTGQNTNRSKQNDDGSQLASQRRHREDQVFPSDNEEKQGKRRASKMTSIAHGIIE